MVNQQDSGRCLSSQAALPPSGLSRQEASQAKPAAANAGEYVVFDKGMEGWSRYDVRRVAKVTAKLVKLERGGYPSQISLEKVVAFCPNVDVARLLCQSAAGIDGEYRRRADRARADYDARVGAAHDAKTKALATLASGMSAGTAETPQAAQGQRPASPVGEAETPTTSQGPNP